MRIREYRMAIARAYMAGWVAAQEPFLRDRMAAGRTPIKHTRTFDNEVARVLRELWKDARADVRQINADLAHILDLVGEDVDWHGWAAAFRLKHGEHISRTQRTHDDTI